MLFECKQGNHILIFACWSGIFSKYMSKRYLLRDGWKNVDKDNQYEREIVTHLQG